MINVSKSDFYVLKKEINAQFIKIMQ